ncbi:MAG: GMC oxidoreductase [Pseudomonadota bacterium]
MITDMTLPRELFHLLASQTFKFDRLPTHAQTLTVMIKVRDELGGHITDGGRVRKSLTKADKDKLRRGQGLATQVLKRAGARNIFKSLPLASHPGGTAKVGEVVDSNLQTEIENLYVCDCSVIPEPWGLPPTLTLLALGMRLARRLATR